MYIYTYIEHYTISKDAFTEPASSWNRANIYKVPRIGGKGSTNNEKNTVGEESKGFQRNRGAKIPGTPLRQRKRPIKASKRHVVPHCVFRFFFIFLFFIF